MASLYDNEGTSTLDDLLNAGGSGLGYIGNLLDKPARAVRGVLRGRPREVLSALPLSDTLGLTNPSQAVSGSDLLESYGWADSGPTAEGGSGLRGVAGLGLEIAADPLNFLALPATAAGRAARNARKTVSAADIERGVLTKMPGTRQGMKTGFDYGQRQLDELAGQLNQPGDFGDFRTENLYKDGSLAGAGVEAAIPDLQTRLRKQLEDIRKGEGEVPSAVSSPEFTPGSLTDFERAMGDATGVKPGAYSFSDMKGGYRRYEVAQPELRMPTLDDLDGLDDIMGLPEYAQPYKSTQARIADVPNPVPATPLQTGMRASATPFGMFTGGRTFELGAADNAFSRGFRRAEDFVDPLIDAGVAAIKKSPVVTAAARLLDPAVNEARTAEHQASVRARQPQAELLGVENRMASESFRQRLANAPELAGVPEGQLNDLILAFKENAKDARYKPPATNAEYMAQLSKRPAHGADSAQYLNRLDQLQKTGEALADVEKIGAKVRELAEISKREQDAQLPLNRQAGVSAKELDSDQLEYSSRQPLILPREKGAAKKESFLQYGGRVLKNAFTTKTETQLSRAEATRERATGLVEDLARDRRFSGQQRKLQPIVGSPGEFDPKEIAKFNKMAQDAIEAELKGTPGYTAVAGRKQAVEDARAGLEFEVPPTRPKPKESPEPKSVVEPAPAPVEAAPTPAVSKVDDAVAGYTGLRQAIKDGTITRAAADAEYAKLAGMTPAELLDVAKGINADATLTAKTPRAKIEQQIKSSIEQQWQQVQMARDGDITNVGGKGAKQPWEMTKKEFDDSDFHLHKDIRSKTPEERDAVKAAILNEGMKRESMSFGNTLPAYRGGSPMDIVQRKYAPMAGERGYLIPGKDVDPKTRNYREGYRPTETDILDFTKDYQSVHEASVAAALAAGKPVPANVLAEYPNLAKAAPSAAPPGKPPTTPPAASAAPGEPDDLFRQPTPPAAPVGVPETPAAAKTARAGQSLDEFLSGIPENRQKYQKGVEKLIRDTPEVKEFSKSLASELGVRDVPVADLMTALRESEAGLTPKSVQAFNDFLDKMAEADRTAKDAKELRPRLAGQTEESIDFGKFNKDAAKVQENYIEKNQKARLGMDAGVDTAIRTLKKVNPNEFAPTYGKYTRLTDLLNDLAPGSPAARATLKSRILQGAKLGPDASFLGIPNEIAEDIKFTSKNWNAPDAVKPIVEAFTAMTSWFKENVTFPFPSFLTRNFMSEIYNNARDGKASKRSAEYTNKLFSGAELPELPGMPKDLDSAGRRDWLNRQLYAHEVSDSRGLIVGDTATGEGALANQRPLGEKNTKLGTGTGTAAGAVRTSVRKAADAIENPSSWKRPVEAFTNYKEFMKVMNAEADAYARTAHFVEGLYQGLSPADSAASVHRTHVRYDKSTPFEKSVLKNVIPFYTYSRNALPSVLEDLATSAKFRTVVRATTSDSLSDGYTPDWIAQGTRIGLPGAPEGKQRFLTGLGLPFDEPFLNAIGSAAGGNFKRAGQTLGSSFNPLLQFPIQEVSGTQLFSGRKLDEIRPSAIAGSVGGGLEDLLGIDLPVSLAGRVVGASPFGRFQSTGDKLFNSDSGLAASLLNVGTGLNVRDIDPAYERAKDLQRALEARLKETGKVKTAQRLYVPDDKKDSLTDKENDWLDAYKGVEDDKRRKSAARRKAEAGQAK